MMKVAKYLQENIFTAHLLNRSALHEAKCDKSGGHPVAARDQVHLLEAIAWLTRSQDAMPYGGLSRGYSFGWNPYFPKRGWQLPHPKASAEAISTLFDGANTLNRRDLGQRAVGLANWLMKIQMSNGAIRGGALDEPPTSEILNTAQAVIGWARAFRETGGERFVQAVRRASDFLLRAQGPRGATSPCLSWRRNDVGTGCHSRTSWALILAGILLEEYQYCAAGENALMRCIQHQQSQGCFQSDSAGDPHVPLLHSMAYSLEGILNSALILDNHKYFLAAKEMADVPLDRIREDANSAGSWLQEAAPSCPMGHAQMANIWLKLYQVTGSGTYLDAAQRTLCFVKRTQNRTASNPGLRGGIKGSFPCDGQFGRYQILSRATISFIDALLSLAHVSQPQQLNPTPSTSPS